MLNEINFDGILGSTPEIVKKLIENNSQFVRLIYECAVTVEPILARISRIFPEYTLHDIRHSARVMDRMAEIIFNINNLSELELAVMALSAILHDVGMDMEHEEYDIITQDFQFLYYIKKYGEKNALSFFIRDNHAERSKIYINKHCHFSTLSLKNETSKDFTRDIAEICCVHSGNLENIEKLPMQKRYGSFSLNIQYCAMILRIADSLDMDSSRTPIFLYNYIKPIDLSDIHWLKHLSITSVEIITEDSYKVIQIYGQCDNPLVHRAFLEEVLKIKSEILYCASLSKRQGKNYLLNLSPDINNFVYTNGFEISDLSFEIDYFAVTKLLAGEQLYRNKKHGLREIVQNSIDACKLRRKILENSGYYPESMNIEIIINQKDNEVIIRDNGVGMSKSIIKNYFLAIGKSFYLTQEYHKLSRTNSTPISCFGIGFLSCFMLSENVVVRTRHYQEAYGHELNITVNSRYIYMNKIEMPNVGTEIVLDYNSFFDVFNNNKELSEYLSKTFYNAGVNIYVIDNKRDLIINNEMNKLYDEYPAHHKFKLDKYLYGLKSNVLIPQWMLDYSCWVNLKDYNNEFYRDENPWMYLYKDNDFIYITEANWDILKQNLHSSIFYWIDYTLENDDLTSQIIYAVISKNEKEFFSFANTADAIDIINRNREKLLIDTTKKNMLRNKVKELFSIKNERQLSGIRHNYFGILSYDTSIFLVRNFISSEISYLRGVSISIRYDFPFFRPERKYDLSRTQELLCLSEIEIDGLYPDVTRDRFLQKDEEELSYAFGKAVCMCLYDNSSDPVYKELIKKLINLYYYKPNPYVVNDIDK